jgi:hypothetical protein
VTRLQLLRAVGGAKRAVPAREKIEVVDIDHERRRRQRKAAKKR